MLDTNICIYLMRHQPPSVAERFAQCRRGDVVISTITLAELEYGVHRCSPSSKLQNRLALDALVDRIPAVPFDRAASNHYAEIRAALPDRRRDALDRVKEVLERLQLVMELAGVPICIGKGKSAGS
ncbi:MAG: type II toxin-antitoxin system VapC family toxin [Thermostichus sp. DG02_5_bins_236]